VRRQKGKWVVGWCLLAIAASIVVITNNVRNRQPSYNATIDRCLGEKVANEVGGLLHGRGNIVVVSLAGGEFQDQMAVGQMEGFRTGLRQYKGVRVIAEERPANADHLGRIMTVQGIPEDLFLGWVHKHPDANAVVSFLGPPRFAATGETVDPSRLPKVIAFDQSREPNWVELLACGAVTVVIWNQPGLSPGSAAQQKDCAAIVDAYCQVVTRSNLGELDFEPRSP
jgi:ABC-type sugar transport system substrate-binding protein